MKNLHRHPTAVAVSRGVDRGHSADTEECIQAPFLAQNGAHARPGSQEKRVVELGHRLGVVCRTHAHALPFPRSPPSIKGKPPGNRKAYMISFNTGPAA